VSRNRTIYALASGAGAAGVAVVRLSGPDADAVLAALGINPLPAPRRASLRALRDAGGEAIDRALVLRFPAPNSFTGEDVAELHVHGGPAVLDALFAAIARSGRARLAEPGEFTRRAFGAGRLDLTAAEGLADLVAARTDAQRRQALRQHDGALADLYEGWRSRLIDAMGWAEAGIDFSDEELPDDLKAKLNHNILCIRDEIREHAESGQQGELIRDGFPVAILGAPNVGKSSIINSLSRRDVAIVTDQAGTTRDVIEVRMDLGGFAVVLSDTAGLREAADAIEGEGVRRAEARAETSGIRLIVLDATDPEVPARVRGLVDETARIIVNKVDLIDGPLPAAFDIGPTPPIPVSAKTGAGIAELLAALTADVAGRLAGADGAAPTRARHCEALGEAADALTDALDAAYPELAAEDVRMAMRALGRITGRVDIDEVLDGVFRDFCIGK
jgi:tRNA modification GTPase